MNEPKRPPRWTIAFLRSLERTAEVRAAAEDAGIDHSTAYARRRAHSDFAAAWDGALERFAAGRAKAEAEEIAAIVSVRPAGEHSGDAGAQLKRSGHDRWSQAKEKLFFDELAGSANVKRAAAAAGVSTNAAYARRMKQPLFRAKWDAVLETGRAAIEMKLVEAANRSFDPEEIDVADSELKVSVAEAIRIVQLHGAKTQRAEQAALLAGQNNQEDIDEVRERVIRKLLRLKQRLEREQLAEGWTLDEAHQLLVPPGWMLKPAG